MQDGNIDFTLKAFINENGNEFTMHIDENQSEMQFRPVFLLYQKTSGNVASIEPYITQSNIKKPNFYYAGVCSLLFVPAFLQQCCEAEQSESNSVMALVPEAMLRSLLPENELYLLKVMLKAIPGMENGSTESYFSKLEELAKAQKRMLFEYQMEEKESTYNQDEKKFIVASSKSTNLSSIDCRLPTRNEIIGSQWSNPSTQKMTKIFNEGETPSISQCLKLALTTQNGEHWVHRYYEKIRPILILHFKDNEGNVIIEKTINTEELSLQNQEYRLAAFVSPSDASIKIGGKCYLVNQRNDIATCEFPESSTCRVLVYELAPTPSTPKFIEKPLTSNKFLSYASEVLLEILKQCWQDNRVSLP